LIAESLVGSTAQASNDMMSLLAEAQASEPSWLVRSGIAPPDIKFTATHTKIGVGPLKPERGGFSVYSECSILRHVSTGRRFISVWQNCPIDTIPALAFIIDRTIGRYIGG
jgi:hypothetical protein